MLQEVTEISVLPPKQSSVGPHSAALPPCLCYVPHPGPCAPLVPHITVSSFPWLSQPHFHRQGATENMLHFFPGNYLISARKKESTGDHSSLPTPSSMGMAPSSPLSSCHCSAGCPLHEPGPRGSQHPQASCPSAAPTLLCCASPLFLLPSDSVLSCKTSAGCRITGCPHSRVETCRAEGLSISSQG